MAYVNRTLEVKSTVEDPVQLDVNTVKLTLNFEYDDDADKVRYKSGKCETKWVTASGWECDEDYSECEWSYSNTSPA